MRVAAIDIGTNSTRLLIADVDPNASRKHAELERHTRVTGLGRGVDANGALAPDAIERTVSTLADYRRAADELAADELVAVATSATRDAANRSDFLASAAEVLRRPPVVITGQAEAELSFRGATAGMGSVADVLVIDIGGGSTEFVTARGGLSVDIGSVRLAERSLPDRPADFDQLISAAHQVDTLLSVLDDGLELSTATEVVGVAGTWTALSAIAQELPAYDRAAVHRSSLSRIALDRLVVSLAAKTLHETQAIPSLDPARAPVILGGAIVARECMRRLGLGHITVSEHDLLDGVVLTVAAGAEFPS